jgi:tetratricopeptide (TPR) repeat protein
MNRGMAQQAKADHDKAIRDYSEAIQLNPNHAGAYYVRGKWNYEVANLNFAERSVAKYLFGGIPDGTLDKAMQDYAKSIKLDPNNILSYLDFARTLEEKEYKDEAVKILNQAITLKPQTEDDPEYLKQCRELLDKLQ